MFFSSPVLTMHHGCEAKQNRGAEQTRGKLRYPASVARMADQCAGICHYVEESVLGRATGLSRDDGTGWCFGKADISAPIAARALFHSVIASSTRMVPPVPISALNPVAGIPAFKM